MPVSVVQGRLITDAAGAVANGFGKTANFLQNKFGGELSEDEREKHQQIKFKFDEIYTTKKQGKKLELLPSCFSLLYVSLMDYEKSETKQDSVHLKRSWFVKNKHGLDTLQEKY